MTNAITGKDQRGVNPTVNTVNTMLDLVKNADKNSDTYIEKLKRDNEELKVENKLIKAQLFKLGQEVDKLTGR